MIIWLLHNQALQLSRAQTLKWQQPPPPLLLPAALISSGAPRAAGLPARCAIWHTEPLTPSLHNTGCNTLCLNNLGKKVSNTDPCRDIPLVYSTLYLNIRQDCWVSCTADSSEKQIYCLILPGWGHCCVRLLYSKLHKKRRTGKRNPTGCMCFTNTPTLFLK